MGHKHSLNSIKSSIPHLVFTIVYRRIEHPMIQYMYRKLGNLEGEVHFGKSKRDFTRKWYKRT